MPAIDLTVPDRNGPAQPEGDLAASSIVQSLTIVEESELRLSLGQLWIVAEWLEKLAHELRLQLHIVVQEQEVCRFECAQRQIGGGVTPGRDAEVGRVTMRQDSRKRFLHSFDCPVSRAVVPQENLERRLCNRKQVPETA